MSTVFEPMPIPPPEDRRVRYRFPIQLQAERRQAATDEAYNDMLLWLQQNLREVIDQIEPVQGVAARPAIRIQRSEWQHPVYAGSDLVDFIDLYAICEGRMWSATPGNTWPITQTTTNNIAFLLVPDRISLRDVVRRIRRMQAHEKCRYVVVSTDPRFREALANQGIDSLLYEPQGG
jgi:hypothetical protein